ncbi:aspartyl/Asparaginyl beta-hydroxylase domain-containing protein [Ditylenchus destructor]|uniref:Aspartyl/Asparaginyl beta-hydroxylase domain-containing protein n=1 Tax=Ditylenchus destructor TaxID=166010 RepID=A0AAD4N4P4_9BILA|nr:aspartyl/Asparaginyl beta-hydroxylase domain-containing protein [Ditylenchus destructor]
MPPPSPSPSSYYGQQNGNATVSNNPTAQNRAQFRRQGSSYGPGHVHNMAVVQIAPRVDYSFSTKGGLRSWAVLIVFILLCMTILTIFSEDDSNDDIQPGPSSSIDQDEEANIAIPQEEEVIMNLEDEELSDDSEEDAEEVLLSKLKEKAILNERRRKENIRMKEKFFVEEDEEDSDEDDEEENKSDELQSFRADEPIVEEKRDREQEQKKTTTTKLNPDDKQRVTHVFEEQERLTQEEEGDDQEESHAVSSIKKKSGGYSRKAITNREDFKFRNELDAADFLMEKHDFPNAQLIYDSVLARYKESPRAHYGLGRVFHLKSEFDSSLDVTEYLEHAIEEYDKVIDDDDTPDELFKLAATELIECAKFIGNLHKAVTVQRALIDRFPGEPALQNEFGKTFLMMGRPDDARKVFTNILDNDPSNSVAQAYYGYILKVYEDDLEKGVQLMKKGLKHEDVANDSKFYFHLGDALTRLGRNQEAYKIYEEGAQLGLFPSVYQRSIHNLDGLVARPWWSLDQTLCGKHLRNIERQWTIIREEALEAWNLHEKRFAIEKIHLNSGSESVLYIRKDMEFQKGTCRLLPNTCEIIKKLVEDSSCVKDEIKISTLIAGSRIWPHCGPTNYELEAELGLQTSSEARIRVGQETRGWKPGKFLVYDPSFETEIWFDGATHNAFRIVLSINLWHQGVPRSFRTQTID